MDAYKTLKTYLLLPAFILVAQASLAHNQAPATIRRSMDKAFTALGTASPANVFKGQKILRVSGTSAQIFEAKKEDKLIGYVAQLEFREQTHVVALDKQSGQVKAVIRDGTPLTQDEWKDFPFIAPLRSALLGVK